MHFRNLAALLVAAALSLPALALAEDLWATADITASRWPEATSMKSSDVTTGTKLTVVFREGDRVRVRIGGTFGWIDAASTSTTAPEGSGGSDDVMDLLNSIQPGQPGGLNLKFD